MTRGISRLAARTSHLLSCSHAYLFSALAKDFQGKERLFAVYKFIEFHNYMQEPITRSFHLPECPFESTLSRMFLFLEAPPTGAFAGELWSSIAICHMLATRKYFNNGEESKKKRGKLIDKTRRC